MIRAVLLLLLVAGCTSTRIRSVMTRNGQYQVDATDMWISNDNPNDPQWIAPKSAVDSLPFSARVLWFFWLDSTAGTALGAGTAAPGPQERNVLNGYNTLVMNFDGTTPTGTQQIKLEAPYLEVEPGATGHGRCNVAAGNARQYGTGPDDANKIVTGTAVGTDGNFEFDLRNTARTYFTHAPFAGQNPFLRTYRRLCYRSGTAGTWTDTGVFIAVTHACLDGITDIATADPGTTPEELDFRCGNQGVNNPALSTGATVTGGLGVFSWPNGAALGATETYDPGVADGETVQMRAERVARTQCCGTKGQTQAQGNVAASAVTLGVCIDTNNNKANCCGFRPYNPNEERCCNYRKSTIRHLDQPCPCLTRGAQEISNGVNTDCNSQGPNVFRDNDHSTGDTLTSDWSCCEMTKFPEFTGGIPAGSRSDYTAATHYRQQSYCYSTGANSDGWRCCNDGNIYDPGSQQCCPINGVQSVNQPCPCGASSDCPTENGPMSCCTQIFPPGLPRGQGAAQCSKYQNWPRFEIADTTTTEGDDLLLNLPANARSQRCPGTCYSTDSEICCNGRVCESMYERCCNNTCCNRFNEGCVEGRRPGAPGNRYNPKDWHVWFETCTSIEHMSARKAFFVFVLPVLLLFATLLSLALVTVLARRATEHIFELTERAMVFCAALATLIACTFFFSPLYKNGLAIAFAGMAAILIAVARKRRASLFLIVVLFFLLMYVIDPFGGNLYLSLSSAVPLPNSINEPPSYSQRKSSSLLESAQWLWTYNADCTEYYQFFAYDNAVRDYERYDNPEKPSYGYCSRSWITALMILAIVLYVLLLLLFLLAIFSYVKKLGMKPVEPIELEVAYEEPMVYEPAPVVAPMVAPLAPVVAPGSMVAPMY
eukprot:NODE_48_length_2764_cov_105.976109_g29_i0.p1 GENE.NODE_48_length_2764_cov_105.976109_g29_i0~~NODE_48_length_2764_cov_105.976109_g29_i0.p1  ORF type:complete len:881 (+),score=256.59 NODE_48_length_2764_cov_105.976109_g29_i0:62-2704(+)